MINFNWTENKNKELQTSLYHGKRSVCSKYHRNNRPTTFDQNGFRPIGGRIFPGSDSSYLSGQFVPLYI